MAILPMPRQLPQPSKHPPTPLLATDKRHQNSSPHPLTHLPRIHPARAQLRVDIQVHEERGVPPLAQGLYEAVRGGELGAGVGFEMDY